LAVVFITAAALTIATGGQPVGDVGQLLLARGVDTVIGCLVGLAVLVLTTPRRAVLRIPRALAGLLAALQVALDAAARGDTGSDAARRARRDLQHRTIVLLQAYDAAIDA